MTVCDSCLSMAKEASEGFNLCASKVARLFGNDIADHVCEGRDGFRKCDCACNPGAKTPLEMVFRGKKN